MIDTLMVLWTRGTCVRLLRALLVFLLLFTVICVLLFLMTASGVKWPGLAVTVSSPSTTTPPAYRAPIILQNPTATPAPMATHTARYGNRRPFATPAFSITPTAMQAP